MSADAHLSRVTDEPPAMESRLEQPDWTDNFYRCPLTGDWVYRWSEDRIVAAVWKVDEP